MLMKRLNEKLKIIQEITQNAGEAQCKNIYNILNKNAFEDFPGGAVAKNPFANARDIGSTSGPGRSHMLWSN